jgi:tetratricopeptide (TPR) repeat protein
MYRIFKISVSIIVAVSFFTACSTKKNTWLNRNYHNTTAYYNIYWNGMETHKALLLQIEGFGYDNYSDVLRVFEYGSILDTSKTIGKTTRMIEKGTKAVEKHSMRIRGVEYVKTMEKAYMMMGIGYFYQHNYSTARTLFNFVSSQFPNSLIRHESMIWSARAYIQEKEYEMASALILQVRNQESNLYKQTHRELPAVTADFFISQGKYDEAVPFLREAISRSKTRDFKNRLEFILGQIYQKEGRLKDAYVAYNNVVRRNPTLELEYNARINMALSYDGSYANRSELVKELKKMLQDTKNERFFGRIYFVLAEMALQDNDISDGIEYLKKSVEYSGSNRDQLAISATRLADLFFDKNDYTTAQRYYKNAVNVMTQEHPDFVRVSTRAENLTELVKYLEVVLHEEQMQYLANLPENRRDGEIDRLIAEYKNKLAESAEAAPKVFAKAGSQVGLQSTWYFYNEQAKSFGANEFVRKWGRRANEDFWFLQQKPAFAVNRAPDLEETQHTEEEQQKTAGDYTPADREYYLVNMHLQTAAKERSNRRLEEN